MVEPNIDKNNFQLEHNPKIIEFDRNISKRVKLDDYMSTELTAEDEDEDELANIPKFWEAGGLCDASLRDKLKSENFNKCLVCNKLIGSDKRQLLKHWKTHHFETELKHSLPPQKEIKIGGTLGKKGRPFGITPGGWSRLQYQCKACDSHIRGCDIPRHYGKKTDWGLLAKMRSTGEAQEESDAHTLFMFENGYTKHFGPAWKSHQQWKGHGGK